MLADAGQPGRGHRPGAGSAGGTRRSPRQGVERMDPAKRAMATNAGRAAIESIDGSAAKFARRRLRLVLSGILGWVTFRGIVNPIQALQTSVESIATW